MIRQFRYLARNIAANVVLALAALSLVAFSTPVLAAITLEMERIDFNDLQHGEIVSADGQFGQSIAGKKVSDGTLGSNSVRVLGVNPNDNSGRDWIVAFDTFQSTSSDPDLEDPFDGGNAAVHTIDGTPSEIRNEIGNTGTYEIIGGDVRHPDLINTDQALRAGVARASRFQSALIIQEAGVGVDNNDDGVIDGNNNNQNDNVGPDDEGRRPAGSIIFDFENPITEIGFDLLDIEGPDEFANDSGYVAAFFQNGAEVARVGFDEFVTANGNPFFDGSVEFGNNSANRIDPITVVDLSQIAGNTITDFDRVEINLGGSGAVDNLVYKSYTQQQSIPEATSLLVWGLLGLTVGGYKQRTRSRS